MSEQEARRQLKEQYASVMAERELMIMEEGRLWAERREIRKTPGEAMTEALDKRLSVIRSRRDAIKEALDDSDAFCKLARKTMESWDWQSGRLEVKDDLKSSSSRTGVKEQEQLRLPERSHFPSYKTSKQEQPANLAIYFRDVKRVLDDNFVHPDRQVAALTLLLPEGQPKEWAYAFRENHPDCSWEELTKSFEKHFTQVASLEQLEQEFEELRQGKRSVFDYYDKFTLLAQGCGIDLEDDRTKRRFRRYLKPDLQRELYTMFGKNIDGVKLSDVYEACQGLESAVYSRMTSPHESHKEDTTAKTWSKTGAKDAKEHGALVCHSCKRPGHKRGDKVCPNYVVFGRTDGKSEGKPTDKSMHGGGKGARDLGKGDREKGRLQPWKCFACGEVGHRSFECPKKKSGKDE